VTVPSTLARGGPPPHPVARSRETISSTLAHKMAKFVERVMAYALERIGRVIGYVQKNVPMTGFVVQTLARRLISRGLKAALRNRQYILPNVLNGGDGQ
jgi:hypothetical protein